MASYKWSFAFCATCAAFGVIVPGCGPRNLSALGNPGDFCTEQTSCTDGSSCRQVDDGYRCVGGPHDRSSTPNAPAVEEDEEPETGSSVATAEGEVGDEGEVMDFDSSSEDAGSAESGDDQYLPPSRRRRGRR